MESMLTEQQKQDEYIRQLASTVDVFLTHNKMSEAQITQQASFSSKPLDGLLGKPKFIPREYYNCVTLKDRVEDPINLEDAPFEEGREINMVESKERNDGGKIMTFLENESLETSIIFRPKLPDLGSFSIPCVVGMVGIERALCDLGVSISLMS